MELIRNLLNLNNRNFGSIEKFPLVENRLKASDGEPRLLNLLVLCVTCVTCVTCVLLTASLVMSC